MKYVDPKKIVKMFGPSISDPSKIVNRDVPDIDVQAYRAAGYQIGEIEVENYIEEVTPEADDKAKPKRKKK